MIKFAGGVTTDLYEEYAASVASGSETAAQAWDLSSALANLQLQRRKARLAAMTGDVAALHCAGINLASVADHHRRSLLHIAAGHGQLEVARLLIKLHPELEGMQDLAGLTAMDYAVDAGDERMADLLAGAGGGLDGEGLLERLVRAVEECDVAGFRRLFKYARNGRRAVAEATDKDGRSLMLICLRLKNALADEDDTACTAMHQELLKCGASGMLLRLLRCFSLSLLRVSLSNFTAPLFERLFFLQKGQATLIALGTVLQLKLIAGLI